MLLNGSRGGSGALADHMSCYEQSKCYVSQRERVLPLVSGRRRVDYIETLPARISAIFLLGCFEGHANYDIAYLMVTSVSAVVKHMARAASSHSSLAA